MNYKVCGSDRGSVPFHIFQHHGGAVNTSCRGDVLA